MYERQEDELAEDLVAFREMEENEWILHQGGQKR